MDTIETFRYTVYKDEGQWYISTHAEYELPLTKELIDKYFLPNMVQLPSRPEVFAYSQSRDINITGYGRITADLVLFFEDGLLSNAILRSTHGETLIKDMVYFYITLPKVEV